MFSDCHTYAYEIRTRRKFVRVRISYAYEIRTRTNELGCLEGQLVSIKSEFAAAQVDLQQQSLEVAEKVFWTRKILLGRLTNCLALPITAH